MSLPESFPHRGIDIYFQFLMDSLTNFLYSLRSILVSAKFILLVVMLILCLWAYLLQLFPQLGTYQLKPKYSRSYLIDPKNRQLQKRLLDLLNGDVAAAKRLLSQQRQLHRGKSDNWYLEKVIYDLERDRR
ncbi:hypothetical protein [Nostoc sp. 2RC]|uniref:hypothetical protein n=1 Tax=Nostoc sp. 2RC TaxID=2485484 RepID=UPI0021AB29DF|nr:hypothetical protein [Nostoc sp. 2RC]